MWSPEEAFRGSFRFIVHQIPHACRADDEQSPRVTARGDSAADACEQQQQHGEHGKEGNDDEEEEGGEAEDGPQRLLDRCTAAVLLKANRLAALLIQQSKSVWRLPASLRSLLDSLVSGCSVCLPRVYAPSMYLL